MFMGALVIFTVNKTEWFCICEPLFSNYFPVIIDSEVKLDEAAVLHYTYAKFSDLTSRRDRCGCKPTKEDVKRCFMLEFDRAVSSLPEFFLLQLLLFYYGHCN